ncbi:LOW QUALITY PROTEIN: sorting nexin-19 [Pituophis catenifer annectens]|uniref:LOW QUALITY PROTEIN: sorting nexin-19 n=1 Tax=Pituophis catenifer annectens TaxID=94852 RepID=UPI003992086E
MLRMPEPGVGLGDLAGSRKLMALGALVGWLLVVHLLVNVWLLCILSGLLALLGAWLGSQVVVGTSHRIHLERFLPLEVCPPNPESERELEEEIRNIIQKIIRDFVSSWYPAVNREQNFEKEVEKAMMGLALELQKRMLLVDKKALTQRVLLLAGCHLQAYKKVQEKWKEAESLGEPSEEATRLWQAYCEFSQPHLAVQSPTHQVEYTRRVVDLLLRVLVPEPHLESRTGRFVVVELVTCNVLMPMINKMADPDWLNQLLIDLFSRKTAGTVEIVETSLELLAASSSQPVVTGVLPPDLQPEMATEGDKTLPRDSEPFNKNVVDSLEDFLMEGKEPVDRALSTPINEKDDGSMAAPLLHPGTLGSFFPSGDLEVESPMSDAGKDSSSLIVVSAEELFASSLLDLEGPLDVDPEDSLGEKDRCAENIGEGFPSEANLQATSLGPCPDIHIQPVAEDTLASLTDLLEDPEKTFLRRPSYLVKELEPPGSLAHSPQDLAQLPSLLSSSPTAPMGTFSFEPLSPDGPVIIQNLRITGTIIAREHSGTGFHPYTLYTVKYDTTLDSDSTNSLQQIAYHTVNRRYREFLNLQTRLEEKPDLRKFIKNIKGPKKLFPDLPFGNMDTEKVEARKSLLESFLKQLCAIPEIANSEEMQEFLALNTDARIAFVKKPFVVSRIDKIVMNAIVDTLKTAFPRPEPQSPTEELSETEVDGKQPTDGKKSNKSKLKITSGKLLNAAGTPEKILYSFRDGMNASEVLSLARMESFIQKQEKFLEAMSSEGPEREGDEEAPSNLNPKPVEVLQQTSEEDTNSGPETLLADVVLDLLCLIMVDQWSWLWSENMQKILHLLFGTLIQRWVEVQVDNLTCTQYWVQYLRLLQESIWPGGVLPGMPRPLRTEEQKAETKEKALQILMAILPDSLQEFLGINKCQQCWSLVLESMQHPSINRHVLYSLMDILMEFLIPDSPTEAPQSTSVMTSVYGAAERSSTSPR